MSIAQPTDRFHLISEQNSRVVLPLPGCLGAARTPDEDILAQPVASLDLPVRLRAEKLPESIRTIGDLLSVPDSVLMKLPGVGRKSIASVDRVVEEFTRAYDCCFDLEFSSTDSRLLLDYAATLCVRALDDRTLSMFMARSLKKLTLGELGREHELTRERVRQIMRVGADALLAGTGQSLIVSTLGRFGRELRMWYSLDVLAVLPRRRFIAEARRCSPRLHELVCILELSVGLSKTLEQAGLRAGTWELLYTDEQLRDQCQEAIAAAAAGASNAADEDLLRMFVSQLSASLSSDIDEVLAATRAVRLVTCLGDALGWSRPADLREFIAGIVKPRGVKLLVTVMREHGKPIHFEHLAMRVNRRLPASHQLSSRVVHSRLLNHKELFARTANGTYALRELGFEDAPQIAEYLKVRILESGRAMHVNELVRSAEQDHDFKGTSIRMTLDLNGRFEDVGGGFYTLAGMSDE